MESRDVKTVADAKCIVEERGITHIKVGIFDVDGVMRGKYMSKDKFFHALDNGFGFCDVVLGWDCNDQVYEKTRVTYTGWHTGYPDAKVRVVPSTCREIPFESGTLLFLAEFDGAAVQLCPRNLLQRILDLAEAMGFSAKAAFEYEFFMFNETPHSIREKNYQNLQPISPGFFGYSMIRNSVYADYYQQILELAEQMDFPIEGIHTETGPGVIEAALSVDNAGSAADKAALFKTYIKIWAQRNNMMATFMAKCSNDYPGQSGHIHMSLFDKYRGTSVFYDQAATHHISKLQRHFIAGQQQLMPDLLAMLAQTVNAFSRLVPGYWAPTEATWGVENRTTALRVIPGSEKSQRVEYRLGSADANPYIALAASLGAGLYGIENELEPSPQVIGNAYEQKHPSQQMLPLTLLDAATALRQSKPARELFGSEFVEHYAASREWESQEFQKHVTDWEMQRYFEII